MWVYAGGGWLVPAGGDSSAVAGVFWTCSAEGWVDDPSGESVGTAGVLGATADWGPQPPTVSAIEYGRRSRAW